jgi:hypothetical protein
MWENGCMGKTFNKPPPPSELMCLVSTPLQTFFFMHPTQKRKKKEKEKHLNMCHLDSFKFLKKTLGLA